MGIQSTIHITRQSAIERIREIHALILNKEYRVLEGISYEPNYSVQNFIDAGTTLDIDNIEKWTNKMLEDIMDCPFVRWSLFDNYLICEDDD